MVWKYRISRRRVREFKFGMSGVRTDVPKSAPVAPAARQRVVYALVDPREPGAIRYVGCTFNPRKRLVDHLNEARDPEFDSNVRKLLFIQQLLCDGVCPMMIGLEEVPSAIWVEREAYWIEKFRSPDLTNFERPPLPETRERSTPNPSAANFFRRSL